MDLKTARVSRGLTVAAFVLAGLLAFSFAFTPLRSSSDEFWHLKTGKWIVEHGWTLPRNDIYGYTSADLPWHNHEWLTQALMWKIYSLGEATELGGWRAIVLAKSLLIVASFAGFGLLLARRMRRPLWAALAAALAVALARRTIQPRPLVVSDLFLGVTFWMLIEWRAGRLRERWLWLLAPLFALWANMHGGWLVGLTMLGAFWVDAVAGFTKARSAERGVRKEWDARDLSPRSELRAPRFIIPHSALFLTLLGVVCVLATLLNPSGYHLYELTSRVMKERYLVERLSELICPDWKFCWIIEGIILAVVAAALRPVRWREWILTALLLAGVIGFFYCATSMEVFQTLRSRTSPPPHWLVWAWRITINPASWAGVAVVALGAAIMRLRRPGWIAHLLLACFWSQQALYHVRHLPLMALAVMPTLAWSLEAWAEAWSRARKRTPEVQAAPARNADGKKEKSKSAGKDAGAAAGVTTKAAAANGCGWLPELAGLAILLALSGYWLFSGHEMFTYAKYNWFLFSGYQTQPMPVIAPRFFAENPFLKSADEPDPPPGSPAARLPRVPSGLPRQGVYFIDSYPVKAVDFMIRAKLPYPLWNGGNYAGYLMWRLSPEITKVFTDNRYDIFGGRVIREEHSVNDGWTNAWLEAKLKEDPDFFHGPTPPPWDGVLDKYGVQTVFIEAGAPGNIALYQSGRWARIWEDFDYNIWVRDTPANKEAIARAQELPRPVTVQRAN